MAIPMTDTFGSSVALVIAGGYFGVEAFNHWKDRPIARWVFVAIASAFVLTGLFLSGLVRQVPKVGEIISSVVTPTFWGVLLIGLFFVLRPLWQPKPQAIVAVPSGKEERGGRLGAKVNRHDAAIAEILERLDDKKTRERLEPLETNYAAILRDYQNMRGLEARFEESLEGLRGKMAMINATYAGEVAGIKDTVEKLRNEIFALNSLNADALAQRFGSVHQSLVAIHYRDRMLAVAKRIGERGDRLYQAVEGNEGKPLTPGEWHKWENSEEKWRADLAEWSSLAHFYVPGVQEKIEAPNRHIFERGNWQFSEEQFPSSGSGSDSHQRSNAVVRYKNFRIAAGNFEAISQQAHDVARKVAFEDHSPPHWQEKK